MSILVFQIVHQPDHLPALARMDVVTFPDPRQALQALPINPPDVLMVDASLPGLDILDTIRAARTVSDCLLLMVADSKNEVDAILALEFGADGYLARPISSRELEAHIQALLRRAPERTHRMVPGEEGIKYRTLFLNIRKCTLSHSSHEIPLTARELYMVRLMMESPGRVFAREEPLEDFRLKKAGDSRAVDMHIANLRKKFAGLEIPYVVLHSVKGRGYRFGPL